MRELTEEETTVRSPRRWLRRLAVAALVLVLALLAAVGGGAFWLKHAMRASLPVIDGQERLPGLAAAVAVRRDTHGIPHIAAANLEDLFLAQGYVTAQDRLWQMDMARRNAAGELAELLGPGLVDHDRRQRLLQMRPTAERMAAALPERDRRYFEAYARGVNAYIGQHGDHLPAEFDLLDYRPRPWKTADSIVIALAMVQMEDEHFFEKIGRERLAAKLTEGLMKDLYPTGSWRDHPPMAPLPDLTQPQPEIPDVPLDETQSRVKVEDLLRLRALARESLCEGCQPGSNEWAVSGAHTASRKPLMSNDMHMIHTIPDIWYETDLKSGSFHAAGVTIAGLPMIVAGHNDHIAWGFTSLYGDTQDIYVEEVNGQGEYKTAEGWRAFDHDRELIRVRGGRDVALDVQLSAHGPVITPMLKHEQRALALRWAAYDASSDGIPLFDLNSAQNWKEFRAAMSGWWGPTLNVIYSDDQGHIGYQAVGKIPMRPNGLAGVPIADQKHEWAGFIPLEALPSALDPPQGLLATANSRITPDGYQYPLTLGWASPYRNERIWKQLAGRNGLKREDMLALQTDIYSEIDQELAQRFAYAIDRAAPKDPRLHEAADLLRSWDGEVTIDSAPAAIVSAARDAWWPLVLAPRLGEEWKLYVWPASAFAQEEIVMHAPPQWLPSGYKDWDALLTAAVKKGLDDNHAPARLKDWRYGNWHPVEVEHPLYGLLPWFKRWTGTGIHPQSGDHSTVKQVGRSFGPSQRFTMDWSDVDASTENIVIGESGNPLSPYYMDQWQTWYEGKILPLPYTGSAVSAATRHTLRLAP